MVPTLLKLIGVPILLTHCCKKLSTTNKIYIETTPESHYYITSYDFPEFSKYLHSYFIPFTFLSPPSIQAIKSLNEYLPHFDAPRYARIHGHIAQRGFCSPFFFPAAKKEKSYYCVADVENALRALERMERRTMCVLGELGEISYDANKNVYQVVIEDSTSQLVTMLPCFPNHSLGDKYEECYHLGTIFKNLHGSHPKYRCMNLKEVFPFCDFSLNGLSEKQVLQKITEFHKGKQLVFILDIFFSNAYAIQDKTYWDEDIKEVVLYSVLEHAPHPPETSLPNSQDFQTLQERIQNAEQEIQECLSRIAKAQQQLREDQRTLIQLQNKQT